MLRSLRCLRSQCRAFSCTIKTADGKKAMIIKKQKDLPQSMTETTWNTLVIGEIVDYHPHPQADPLNVCIVNIGDEEKLLQIICGASNVRVGARIPVATVGTRLAIKEHVTGDLKKLKIKKSKLRGEISQGMICSEAELGLADESDGIFIFEADARVGSLVIEHHTIASRLIARGISVPSSYPTNAASLLQAKTEQ